MKQFFVKLSYEGFQKNPSYTNFDYSSLQFFIFAFEFAHLFKMSNLATKQEMKFFSE
jgi:hypothetical protein